MIVRVPSGNVTRTDAGLSCSASGATATTLEAIHRAGQGDTTGGLHALEGARTEVWFQHAMASPVFAGVEGRLLRAELLHACDRSREATGWLASIGWHSVWELSHRSRAARRAAEISKSVEALA